MQNSDIQYKTKLSEFVQCILDTADVKISKSGVVKINSVTLLHTTIAHWFIGQCKEPGFHSFSDLISLAPSVNIFFDELRKNLSIQKTKMKLYSNKSEFMVDFSYEDFIPVISITDYSHTVFFNKKTRRIAQLDYKTYLQTTAKEGQIPPVRAIIEFNPYNPEQVYLEDTEYGPRCSHINTYTKPEWQLDRELTPEEVTKYSKLPSELDRFFKHLFPLEECREFIYDWLHYALTHRCETYLVLNGAKGIGKNILSEHVCKALLGKNNHKLAPPGALESNFNAMLVDSRMIVFDEFKIEDDEKINKLKRYVNEDQSIEFKGQDVGKTRKTFNSFIISNNSLSDIKISWDERRFSVADLTDKKLDLEWKREEIQSLVDAMSDVDSDMIRNFGYWLMYRKPNSPKKEFQDYKGSHFYKLCYSSLPEWCKVIIEECQSCSKDSIDSDQLREAMRERNPQGRPPMFTKISDFIANYRHNGTHYLGEIVMVGREYTIKINPELKAAKDSTGIEWRDINDDSHLL